MPWSTSVFNREKEGGMAVTSGSITGAGSRALTGGLAGEMSDDDDEDSSQGYARLLTSGKTLSDSEVVLTVLDIQAILGDSGIRVLAEISKHRTMMNHLTRRF